MASNVTEKLLKVLCRRSEFPQDLHDKFALFILSETVSNIVYIFLYISAAIYLRLLIRDRPAQMKAVEERRMIVSEKSSKF